MTDTYTLEVYKADRRTKRGERLVLKEDYEMDFGMLEKISMETWPVSQGYRREIHLTYIERTSFMDPSKTFLERYDTPYYCSPSSETYWSM